MEAKVNRASISDRKLAKETRNISLRPVPDDYWPTLIAYIRSNQSWNQTQFAHAVKSNQETVSRWEAGAVKPSAEKGALIERLAKRSLPTVLKEIGSIIKASPFPMILTDVNHTVLAASKSSGFKTRKTVSEQTPPDEVKFFEKFSNSLKRRGFWKKGGQRFTYKFVADGVSRQAVVVSIAVNREVFAVVQQGTSD